MDSEVNNWVVAAGGDLDAARVCVNAKNVNCACYHVQQTIEKILKSALVYTNGNTPHSHILEELFNSLSNEWNIKNTSYNLEKISEWVSSARYPDTGFIPPVEDDMYYGLKTAQEFYDSITTQLKNYGVI